MIRAIDTHTVAWVTGVTGAPLIEKLGLPTENGSAEGAGRISRCPVTPTCSRPATPPRCPT